MISKKNSSLLKTYEEDLSFLKSLVHSLKSDNNMNTNKKELILELNLEIEDLEYEINKISKK